MHRSGDWADQLRDYCPTSKLPMDEVINRMEKSGIPITALSKLERLSDERILARVPTHRKPLKYNSSSDASFYIKVWSEIIKEELLNEVELPKELLSQLSKKNYALESQ